MNCPSCAREMTPGTLKFKGGETREGPFFCASDGEQTYIFKHTTHDAFQCEDCATIVLQGRYAGDPPPPESPYR
jgi:hypothetical protein